MLFRQLIGGIDVPPEVRSTLLVCRSLGGSKEMDAPLGDFITSELCLHGPAFGALLTVSKCVSNKHESTSSAISLGRAGVTP